MKNNMSLEQILKAKLVMKRLDEMNDCDKDITSIKTEYNDGMKIEYHRIGITEAK